MRDKKRKKKYDHESYLRKKSEMNKKRTENSRKKPHLHRLSQAKYRKNHPDKIKKQQRKYWKKITPEQNKNRRLKNRYKITLKDYDEMFVKQNGKCLICKEKNKRLVVDHNHRTLEVRGLICDRCNMLVGIVEDRGALLMEAGRYLLNKGGRKDDSNKLIFSNLPVKPLEKLVEVYNIGANKYGNDNWRDGMLFSRIFSALQRHAWKWWNGEEKDEVDGQHHLASVAWCAFTLLEYLDTLSEFDDRVKKLG